MVRAFLPAFSISQKQPGWLHHNLTTWFLVEVLSRIEGRQPLIYLPRRISHHRNDVVLQTGTLGAVRIAFEKYGHTVGVVERILTRTLSTQKARTYM